MDYLHFDDHEKIGEYVRYYRKQKNMTQAQLAAAVGTSRTAISALESRNHRLSIGLMMNIADCVGMPMPFLFKSVEVTVVKDYVIGRTLVMPDGSIQNFGAVQVPADYINDSIMICVSDDNGRYIADKGCKNRGRRVLCAKMDSGELFISTRSKISKLNNDEYFVVAGIITKDVSANMIDLKF